MYTLRPLLLVAPLILFSACGGGEGGSEPGAGGGGAGADGDGVVVPERIQSVILFTVDTLRADRLGCYGSTDGVTPHLDRLASESILFLNPYTQASHTHAAVSAMMTGLFPHHTGVLGMSGKLADTATPVAVTAQKQGIPTGEFSASHCGAQGIEGSVWHDGWDEIFCGKDWNTQHYDWDEKAVTAGMEWIQEQDGPFLCWIHLIDPHGEHIPPPTHWDYDANPVWDGFQQGKIFQGYANAGKFPPKEEMDIMNALYLAEVAGVDDQLGRVTALLETLPNKDEIALIFSADHGEELFETAPRWGHGRVMTEGVLHVPLIVHVPGVSPAVVEDPVETLQVAPTTLQLLDLPFTRELDGASLLSARPSRGWAISYYGSCVTLRRGDERAWMNLESLPQDPMYVHYEQIERKSPVPWFASELVAASYDGEAKPPTYYDDAQLEDEGFEQRLVIPLRDHLSKLNPVKELRTVDFEGNAAFLEELRSMGYLGDE
ncbi:MAG: sulfatase [Planctomycetota bacterium]